MTQLVFSRQAELDLEEIGEGIRACPHGRYVIFFRPAEAYVLVVRILAGARHLPEVFESET